MNFKKENLDKILDRVMLLRQKKESLEALLSQLPEDEKNEFREFLAVMNMLNEEKEKSAPPKELLSKILSKIEISTGVEIKRTSIFAGIMNRWKFVVPVVAVAAVLAIVLSGQFTEEKIEFVNFQEFAIDEKEIAMIDEELNQFTIEEVEIDKAFEELLL